MRFRIRKDTLIAFLLTTAAVIAVTAVFGLLPDLPLLTPQRYGQEEAEVFSPSDPGSGAVFVGYTAPLCGKITSRFGQRTDPISLQPAFHRGIDIAADEGTEVLAAAEGIVKESAYNTVGGNYIILDHGNGEESYYGHLQTRLVAKGDAVSHGQTLGLSGATGMTTGPHLHFQLIYKNTAVDPLDYIVIPNEKLY